MSKVLLISIETLKKEYLVDDNLDDKYIISNIQKCQDFRLEPMVEDLRWDEIISKVASGTVSPANDNLIKKYFQPIIAYYVMSEIVYSTAYKLKNQGMGSTEDKSNQFRFKELIEISNKYKKDSEAYEQIFKEYIRETGEVQVDETYVFKSTIYLGNDDIYRNGYHTIAHKNERKGTGV